jgi:S-formylglutathione hydrolase FrmB
VSSGENFGVLYLLHGLFGRFDNWITNTDLVNHAESFPFIIICAEGGDGWYTDSAEIENHFFESYLTKELIPDVERRFKVRSQRNSRAIAGLSMGGYGAFKLAFRQPEMFCLAASMSGAFHAAEIFGDSMFDEWKELQPSILKVFGSDNQEVRKDNDLFQIVNNFPSEQSGQLPYFYFDCGAEDSFLPVNLRLAEIFRKKEIAHDFRQFSGGHDWSYWNEHIQQILRLAKLYLAA